MTNIIYNVDDKNTKQNVYFNHPFMHCIMELLFFFQVN